MKIVIPQCSGQKVEAKLMYLNNLANSDLSGAREAREAKKALNSFWINAERLKMFPSGTIISKDSFSSVGLPVRHVSSNFFSLTIGLDAYIFAIENGLCVFLTECKRGLECHAMVIAEARSCLNLWKKSRGM